MYIIKNKKRKNTEEVLKNFYQAKVVNKSDKEIIDLGGEDFFETKNISKDYYTRKLGFSASLAMANQAQKIYKTKYKKYLTKHLTLDIMASDKEYAVGVLLRYRRKMVAVIENWQVTEEE
jgi:hypothetical protein